MGKERAVRRGRRRTKVGAGGGKKGGGEEGTGGDETDDGPLVAGGDGGRRWRARSEARAVVAGWRVTSGWRSNTILGEDSRWRCERRARVRRESSSRRRRKKTWERASERRQERAAKSVDCAARVADSDSKESPAQWECDPDLA